MIGFNRGFLEALTTEVPADSVFVLEEPDVIRKNHLEHANDELDRLARIVPCAYHEANDFLRIGVDLHERAPFTAVVPAREYAVPAAAALATRFGMPGASEGAAATLRNKMLLRTVTACAGVRNPEWCEVRRVDDVRAFAACGPVVIKPATRQASLGVQVLDAGADLDAAWNEMVTATETPHVPDRRLASDYVAERRLVGAECSVEAIVRGGRVLFDSVTEKTVLPGPHPVELGHVVPEPIGAKVAAALSVAMRALVEATGFVTGVLHAEWFLTDDGPVLVECAGRIPGDHIFDLIELARGAPMYGAVLDVLSNRPFREPGPPRRAAAIRFLVATPGRVREVRGVSAARGLGGVRRVKVSVGPGDIVRPCRSSWDRCGWVIATAPDAERARALAEQAAAAIEIETTGPVLPS